VIADRIETIGNTRKSTLPLIATMKCGIRTALPHLNAAEIKLDTSKRFPSKHGGAYANVCQYKLRVRLRSEMRSQFICTVTAPFYYLKVSVQTFNQCNTCITSTERQKLGQSFSYINFEFSSSLIKYPNVYLERNAVMMLISFDLEWRCVYYRAHFSAPTFLFLIYMNCDIRCRLFVT
jgi:hypothetical protein